jgi:hypothetical protein
MEDDMLWEDEENSSFNDKNVCMVKVINVFVTFTIGILKNFNSHDFLKMEDYHKALLFAGSSSVWVKWH